MPHARLRFVAAGAAAVTGLAGLALAPGTAQRPPPSSGAPGQLQRQDTHEQGVRRRGHLRRPGGIADRRRGAPQGRQRGRRRGRDGCGPRGHRAVQLRHRWRRLLRPLQRAHRQGGHARRPRDRPAEHAEGRVHRPRDRQDLPADHHEPRTGHQRCLGRHPGHPRHVGEGAREVGLHQPRQGAAPRDEARRARLRGRHHLQRADRGQQAAVLPVPRDQQAVPAGRQPACRSARCSATPTSPTPTG